MECIENDIEYASVSPPHVVVIGCLPRPIAFGKIAPGSAGRQNPHGSIEHDAEVAGRTTGLGLGLRK
jgi:hypothetical protein